VIQKIKQVKKMKNMIQNWMELPDIVFSMLKREGFTYEQMKYRNKFEDYRILPGLKIVDIQDLQDGLHIGIRPTIYTTKYDWKPRMFTGIHTQASDEGILIRRKDSDEALVRNPEIIKDITLYYLPKNIREK
jgi:hypothetical protein